MYAIAVRAGATVSDAQSVLTTITVFCGLGLLPLIYPAEPEPGMSRERRLWPWLLSGIMAAVYIVFLEIPVARDFYQMSPVEPATIGVLLALGIVWTVAVHLIRRTHVVLAAENVLIDFVQRSWAARPWAG